ncbi:hypothetical protein TSYNTROOL_14390 [Tepidanaerobacter syntrophicus]|uniref:hypothetical protein n=1 Tax=Tepidanaerobacter syntrophicus TaxID=224999 RepID=UPI0022EF6057|nr:hypothetical protein [Tepidanaerobacter syntrophicus]GLI51353.1 hypothetical protein TSYNTROOL_14390 [Tepidanaerobacter syntrophicus]
MMLSEMTWYQLTEWEAYFSIKDEIEKEQEKEMEKKIKEEERQQRNLQAAKRGRW